MGIDRSPSLTCNHEAPIAAYSAALRGRDGGATAELGGETAGTLRASSGGGDKAHVLAFDARQDCVSSAHTFGALGASSPQAQAVTYQMAVRRLTPRECARLQGFPDDYLEQVIVRGKPAADGPMYKAFGNSMAVPCMAFIGKRINAVLEAA